MVNEGEISEISKGAATAVVGSLKEQIKRQADAAGSSDKQKELDEAREKLNNGTMSLDDFEKIWGRKTSE